MPPRKKLKTIVKVQLPAGAATPAPPVGTALGPHGVNIMDFVKQYNAATEAQRGNIIPVEISIFEDRSFTFITKTPPAPEMIKKAAGVDKGSAEPHKTKVGSLTMAQVRQIAETKMPDLNATSIEAAEKIIAGTARSGADQEGRGRGQGQRRAAQDQGGQHHQRPGPRHRADQDAGPERHHGRGGGEDHRRHGPLHGHQGRRLSFGRCAGGGPEQLTGPAR